MNATELMEVLATIRTHGSIAAGAKALGTDPATLHAKWREAKRRLRLRRAQARYQRTAKGRASVARYNASPKRHVTNTRYRATEHGHRVMSELNAKRIFVGDTYRGRAQTVETAAIIRSHIKERIRAFTRQQTGA